jgi:hypothetical protein
MPISPSDLAWWQWLLVSAGAFIIACATQLFTVEGRRGCVTTLLFVASLIVSLLAGVIGIVRFIKFAWQG